MAQNQRQRINNQESAQQPQSTLPLPVGQPGQVRVITGADVQDLDLGGRTVGEARTVAEAVFGINEGAVALVDGQAAGEEQVLVPGQMLEFVKYSGQKGAARPKADAAQPAAGSVIEVVGDQAIWRQQGKQLGSMALRDLWQAGNGGCDSQRWPLYPPHVRLMVERGRRAVTGVVIEMPPGPRQVRWISDDSTAPFGPECEYREYRLSFPWVVLVIVFVKGQLSGLQQAFYRTTPIESLDDELQLTNLLNVAQGYGQESWVCLANLRSCLGKMSWGERIRTVTDHFWRAAFNRSSEEHEGNSFWESSRGFDDRLETPQAWEAATRDNPYFTLQVAWPRAPRTLRETLENMLEKSAPARPIERVEQLVTLIQGAEAHE
jgi:hypothetical protein